LTGRLKRYSSTESILSQNSNNNRRSTSFFHNINTKRTINPSLSVNLDDINNKKRIKRHTLSNLHNKSSNVITPGTFNPLINYEQGKEKISRKKIKRNCYTNSDHFHNMTPTQLYKYRPHVKPSKYNYHLISQIDSLPGPNKAEILKKRTGKRIFKSNLFEESKDDFDKNTNNNNHKKNYNNVYKNSKITNVNNNRSKFSQVYEFDDPVISYRDICKKINLSKLDN